MVLIERKELPDMQNCNSNPILRRIIGKFNTITWDISWTLSFNKINNLGISCNKQFTFACDKSFGAENYLLIL
jgi:hypothetical protein